MEGISEWYKSHPHFYGLEIDEWSFFTQAGPIQVYTFWAVEGYTWGSGFISTACDDRYTAVWNISIINMISPIFQKNQQWLVIYRVIQNSSLHGYGMVTHPKQSASWRRPPFLSQLCPYKGYYLSVGSLKLESLQYFWSESTSVVIADCIVKVEEAVWNTQLLKTEDFIMTVCVGLNVLIRNSHQEDAGQTEHAVILRLCVWNNVALIH